MKMEGPNNQSQNQGNKGDQNTRAEQRGRRDGGQGWTHGWHGTEVSEEHGRNMQGFVPAHVGSLPSPGVTGLEHGRNVPSHLEEAG